MQVAWKEVRRPTSQVRLVASRTPEGLRRTPKGIVASGDIEMTEPVLITRADVAPRGSSETLVERPEGAWCETGETSVAVEPESVCEERETRTNKQMVYRQGNTLRIGW